MNKILNPFDSEISTTRNELVFEGRNKQYGAYEIRNSYNGTMIKSICIAIGLVFALCMFQKRGTPNVLAVIPRTMVDTTTVIIEPDKVKPETETKKTTSSSQGGAHFIISSKSDSLFADSAVYSGVGGGTPGNDTATGKFTNTGNGTDSVATIVKTFRMKPDERDATFEGGEMAFYKWFERNMVYPEDAVYNGSQGRVKIQFYVDVTGSLSNFSVVQDVIEAPELADEAIRVLKMSPKWTPASQNGIKVPAYRVIPIDFVLN